MCNAAAAPVHAVQPAPPADSMLMVPRPNMDSSQVASMKRKKPPVTVDTVSLNL